jgi:hypothetical protein
MHEQKNKERSILTKRRQGKKNKTKAKGLQENSIANKMTTKLKSKRN